MIHLSRNLPRESPIFSWTLSPSMENYSKILRMNSLTFAQSIFFVDLRRISSNFFGILSREIDDARPIRHQKDSIDRDPRRVSISRTDNVSRNENVFRRAPLLLSPFRIYTPVSPCFRYIW